MQYIPIIIIILLVIPVLYIYLIAPRMFKKPATAFLKAYHYAHRGLFDNSSYAPENSLKAFELAISHNFGIELDVQLTKDNIPVVFHDATLERMCGQKQCLGHLTLAELRHFSLANSAQHIPTLKEALDTIAGRVPLIIEIKPYDKPSLLCSLVWKQLSVYHGQYCIESFHPFALKWFRKHHPSIVRGQLCMEYWREKEYRGQVLYLLLSFLITNFLSRPDFIAYKHTHAGNLSRKICAKLGAISVAWTIQSANELESARQHYDAFIFDSFIP